MLVFSCGPSPSDDNTLAAAYAEILIVQAIHRNDTVSDLSPLAKLTNLRGLDANDDDVERNTLINFENSATLGNGCALGSGRDAADWI